MRRLKKHNSSCLQMLIQEFKIIRAQLHMNARAPLRCHAERSWSVVMHEQPDRTAGRPSDTDHRKLGGLVDLHAEAKFARIEFDGAFYVGDAQGEPFQSNLGMA